MPHPAHLRIELSRGTIIPTHTPKKLPERPIQHILAHHNQIPLLQIQVLPLNLLLLPIDSIKQLRLVIMQRELQLDELFRKPTEPQRRRVHRRLVKREERRVHLMWVETVVVGADAETLLGADGDQRACVQLLHWGLEDSVEDLLDPV